MRSELNRLAFVIVTGAVIAAVACSDPAAPVTPGKSPLAGLSKGATNDTSNGTTQNGTGSGVVSGTVLGPAAPGSTGDTLSTMPRVGDVKVTVFAGVQTGEIMEAGDEIVSVMTGADGKFTLPELPAGTYVVTFVPPATSDYRGMYVTGWVSGHSSKYPWWIVLSKK